MKATVHIALRPYCLGLRALAGKLEFNMKCHYKEIDIC